MESGPQKILWFPVPPPPATTVQRPTGAQFLFPGLDRQSDPQSPSTGAQFLCPGLDRQSSPRSPSIGAQLVCPVTSTAHRSTCSHTGHLIFCPEVTTAHRPTCSFPWIIMSGHSCSDSEGDSLRNKLVFDTKSANFVKSQVYFKSKGSKQEKNVNSHFLRSRLSTH